MCRFYLKQTHPRFQLYVSPINIDPADPALPISTPSSYSRSLTDEIGEFHTQGIAEDTKALSDGMLDDKEYLQQARTVLAEHRRIFDAEFPKFNQGVFFFYFSSLDLNSHMFWRLMDPNHPEYDAALAEQNGSAIADFYQQIDQVLGEVLPRLDDRTTLLVLSDHGFAPYNRSFNLNTWLLNNGYIKLKSGASTDSSEPLANVDWTQTRAYGLGLNGLYLNLKGRETNGIVEPSAADALMAEIRAKLLAVHDPKSQQQVITRIDLASDVYQGPYAQVWSRHASRLQPRIPCRMADNPRRIPAGRTRRQFESLERRPLHGLHPRPRRPAQQSQDLGEFTRVNGHRPNDSRGVWNRQGTRYDWTIRLSARRDPLNS